MASIEGIGSKFFKQRSERSPKLRTHQSPVLLNKVLDCVTLLRDMEKLSVAGKKSVQGKVVDYISHFLDEEVLYMNVFVKNETLFCFRFACYMFIARADFGDWKTGNCGIIRGYMIKFRNKIGVDVALEALRESRRIKKPSMDELWAAAKICRVANICVPIWRHSNCLTRRSKIFPPRLSLPLKLLNILSAAPAGLRAFFDCVAVTGTRLGEVLALKWKRVDLERRILRIEHSLWRSQLLSPKTTASTRDITLGSALNETLRNHRESSLHRGPDDFVFCKKDGSALDPDVLRKDAFYPIFDRLGIPRKKGASGFHTFRHSAASIVNEQTGNLKLAQKFLGHSTIKMTPDIYTHTSAEAERDAAIALERAIYGDLFPVVPNIENRNNFAAAQLVTVNRKGA